MSKILVANFKIAPARGWDFFSRHVELADLIYDSLAPFVNQKKFNYLNLFPGCGVFEDPFDNSLFILFDDSKRKERIVELRLSQSNPEPSSQLLTLADLIVNKYQLEKICID